MWPIIKKELRENARYLLGAFAIVLFFLDIGAFGSGWILLGFGRLLANRSGYGGSRCGRPVRRL